MRTPARQTPAVPDIPGTCYKHICITINARAGYRPFEDKPYIWDGCEKLMRTLLTPARGRGHNASNQFSAAIPRFVP